MRPPIHRHQRLDRDLFPFQRLARPEGVGQQLSDSTFRPPRVNDRLHSVRGLPSTPRGYAIHTRRNPRSPSRSHGLPSLAAREVLRNAPALSFPFWGRWIAARSGARRMGKAAGSARGRQGRGFPPPAAASPRPPPPLHAPRSGGGERGRAALPQGEKGDGNGHASIGPTISLAGRRTGSMRRRRRWRAWRSAVRP